MRIYENIYKKNLLLNRLEILARYQIFTFSIRTTLKMKYFPSRQVAQENTNVHNFVDLILN